VLVLVVVGRMGRASRQRAYEEEQRRLEESRQDGVEAFSPFSTLPFGGLLEELMRGMGPAPTGSIRIRVSGSR
jgi:hypothetical protein